MSGAPATKTGDVVVSVRGASKVYPGTRALDAVDFDVRRGMVNVLVGENGAGKSTLMKIIAGVERPTEGEVLVDGAPVRFESPADAARHGIGIVFQELNLFPNMSIAENIFIGREVTRGGIDIDARRQRETARALMARLEHDNPPDTPVADLRIGEQQIVEIAKVLSQDARVIIMDEPTSALSAAEVEILFRVIGELKAAGTAIVYISHRLEELVRVGDWITVLRDGKVTGSQPMSDVDVDWIVRAMIGARSKDFAKEVAHDYGATVLAVSDVSLPRRGGGFKVDHVSLSLKEGEIVGIYGLMGAGRSELFDCIIGRERAATGSVVLAGREISGRSIHGRIEAGIALIPEDRKAEGLVQILPVSENMSLSSLSRFVRLFHLDVGAERRTIADYVKRLAVKVADVANPVSSLSGGNQQKVVIGKALMTGPKVLLMDEPSRGIDIGAKAEVFRVMRELAAEGLGILFVTSDLQEVMELSDRIIVMSNGRITGELAIDAADEATIVRLSSVGHGPHHAFEETAA
ncbi:sugar ABC transporter ATP-binding protein [Acuticoccus sp. I52.16.1]|uniref:sugar ABC transporter ATP-binding protein n=1 Tax=Acuticoccus sp. I52.16.1 TaxID=2928472 RepID=UPI001FD2FEA2|nr:sugar ABC transporter ATP-binding protein [Acuticoccus sp. I52.16.1]UOM34367.1 sugar ABC transporter ATP-binding protein [Acuticoccus sp. I52.16.1]